MDSWGKGQLFRNNKSLTKITFKGDVTQILEYDFENCSSLTEIDGLTWSNLTSIGTNAFYGCSCLSGTIYLNRSCSYDIENSFQNCGLTVKFTN